MAAAASKKQVESWFKPGIGGNPAGKAKGTPNKLTKSIKDMILGALQDVGGRDYLARQAEANPVAFMGLLGKVLPLQLAGHDGQQLVVDFRWADDTPVDTTPVIEAVADGPVFDAEPDPSDAADTALTVTWAGE